MDLSQIVALVSSIALGFFTIVLAVATIYLAWTTKRYADATKEMAQSTERLLEMERLKFVDGVFHHTHDIANGTANLRAVYGNTLLSVGQKSGMVEGVESGGKVKAMRDKLDNIHAKLTEELLVGLVERFPEDDTPS